MCVFRERLQIEDEATRIDERSGRERAGRSALGNRAHVDRELADDDLEPRGPAVWNRGVTSRPRRKNACRYASAGNPFSSLSNVMG